LRRQIELDDKENRQYEQQKKKQRSGAHGFIFSTDRRSQSFRKTIHLDEINQKLSPRGGMGLNQACFSSSL